MDAKDLAYEDYQNGMKYQEIADKYGVSINTVKSWKQRHNWQKGVHTKLKKGAHKNTGAGAPKGNKNAVGHGAPTENKNAEKHGFFSKWLPEETLEIMQEIERKTPLDLLWDQIMIQYTAIIRAQKIMYVRDREDMTRVITMDSENATAYDVQQAWDKQATFLQAQSRAMQTLNGLIKQYEELLRSSDVKEEQRARIEKIKAETERLKSAKDVSVGNVYFTGEDDLLE